MNKKQIDTILHSGKFQHAFKDPKLVETHISYVLLGSSLAYKFKKEIKYSFLDFSTLQKRKYFCERELVLNNRISTGVYLKVVPVRQQGKDLNIAGTGGKIIDYALKMKRLKDAKQMHLMLDKKRVNKDHIKALAVLIRKFHQQTTVIKNKFNQQHFATRFNDLLSVKDTITSSLGAAQAKIIEKAVRVSDKFLQSHYDLFTQRVEGGFVRDCHGDLHSRNIFLYRKPIIFDCLEFNDEFRQIDILDELAFFCMDLEADGFYTLSKAFTDHYFSKTKKQFGSREQLLFTYYKCYRANVRAKVNALRTLQADDPLRNKRLEDVKKYLALMNTYLDELA